MPASSMIAAADRELIVRRLAARKSWEARDAQWRVGRGGVITRQPPQGPGALAGVTAGGAILSCRVE
jgi:hypothetical protein